MPRPLPQRHQGGWGVAPSHLLAARGLQAAEARPKATPRIHMQMSMKTGFYLFSKFLKIEQPHNPTANTEKSASSSRFKWCLGFPCGSPDLSIGNLNINTAYFCDLALGGAGSSYCTVASVMGPDLTDLPSATFTVITVPCGCTLT